MSPEQLATRSLPDAVGRDSEKSETGSPAAPTGPASTADTDTGSEAPLSNGESPPTDPSGLKASVSTCAREVNADSPMTQRDPLRVRWARRLARLAAYWQPPEIVSEPRPALATLWRYARDAEWAATAGPLRRAGQVYAVLVSLPVHTVGYLALWILERPTRAASVAALAAAAAATPPGEVARAAAAAVLRTAAGLLG